MAKQPSTFTDSVPYGNARPTPVCTQCDNPTRNTLPQAPPTATAMTWLVESKRLSQLAAFFDQYSACVASRGRP